jgi:hypothetical protein
VCRGCCASEFGALFAAAWPTTPARSRHSTPQIKQLDTRKNNPTIPKQTQRTTSHTHTHTTQHDIVPRFSIKNVFNMKDEVRAKKLEPANPKLDLNTKPSQP